MRRHASASQARSLSLTPLRTISLPPSPSTNFFLLRAKSRIRTAHKDCHQRPTIRSFKVKKDASPNLRTERLCACMCAGQDICHQNVKMHVKPHVSTQVETRVNTHVNTQARGTFSYTGHGHTVPYQWPLLPNTGILRGSARPVRHCCPITKMLAQGGPHCQNVSPGWATLPKC